jgi:transposase-like protein
MTNTVSATKLEHTMNVDLELLKAIVKECLENQASERIIAKQFGLTEEQMDQLYEAVQK